VVAGVVADDPDRDWTEPGVFEAAPGVFRIPLPLPTDGLRAVNVYAVVDGADLVLIDSGWAIAEAKSALLKALAGLDRDMRDVRRFLVTHVHRDHYTQAVVLRREFGTEIALGKEEHHTLDRIAEHRADPGTEPMNMARLRSAGATELVARLIELNRERAPESDDSAWELPDEWLADRATATIGSRELTAVHTPGHTRGHLVFAEPANGLMFAGDHVLPHITPSIGFEGAPSDFPLYEYLESLRLVRGMPDARLLPAHGKVAPSVHARVDELLAHHDRRLALTAEIVERGASTAAEAAALIGWTRRERKLAELDPFNQMLAVLETKSHLDVLMLQGRLSRTDVDGIEHYRVG
jgi:glyoxylase-like metal-dependent hydrolase (beta-lactamase superfamily II)